MQRRGLAGVASNGSSARAQLDVSARKEKGTRTRSLQSSRTDKARAESEVRRRSRRVEVAGAVPIAGMGVGARTVMPQGRIVTRLTIFDSILTAQNSNFHMETLNLAKIEVVEEEKIYNFCFGQNLI